MALFTDIEAVTADDLVTFETTVLQTASAHGISVAAKVELGRSAVGDRVMLWLLDSDVTNPQWLNSRQAALDAVVLTAHLKRWVCMDILARIYAEAYNVQLNTRFLGKWNEYKSEARGAADLVMACGIGMVSAPLPQPGKPLVSIQSGNAPSLLTRVRASWTSIDGIEGALSSENSFTLPELSSFATAMAEGALNAPRFANGWNIYVGFENNSPTRQNLAPIAIGSTWQLPTNGLRIGEMHSGDQQPVRTVTLTRKMRRG